MDVKLLTRRLGISNPRVESKAMEYMRLANAKLAGASLGTAYKNARAMLQKLLGIRTQTSPRDLCLQFGCVRLERPTLATLATLKERYVARLPSADRGTVALGKPAFVAAVFLAMAQKHKIKVDKRQLLEPLGITPREFSSAWASVTTLLPDLVGVPTKKRRRGEDRDDAGQENEAELGNTGPGQDVHAPIGEGACGSSDEEVLDDGAVGRRVNPANQKRREYEAWKDGVIHTGTLKGSAGSNRAPMQQTKLSFLTNKADPHPTSHRHVGSLRRVPDQM